MRSFSVAAIALLALASCTQGARVDCTVAQAPGAELVVRQLDVNSYKSADTLRADASGHVRFDVKVEKESPEFVYVFYKDTRIASLLLQAGDKVRVEADTLGHYSVEGSEESSLLALREEARADFAAVMNGTDDSAELTRAYVEFYRDCVKYVISHPGSMTVIPVLYEQLDAWTPVFSRTTDALIFRSACDSLKAVWPESRFVKALDKEALRRENELKMRQIVGSATETGFPDLDITNVNGERTRLSEVDSRAILVHFWDSADASHKMFNLDVLVPLWERWHARGFEIYAIDVNPDKAVWASVVRAQKLPWVNVNDGRGGLNARMTYNAATLPSTFLIVDGDLSTAVIAGAKDLDKELARFI